MTLLVFRLTRTERTKAILSSFGRLARKETKERERSFVSQETKERNEIILSSCEKRNNGMKAIVLLGSFSRTEEERTTDKNWFFSRFAIMRNQGMKANSKRFVRFIFDPGNKIWTNDDNYWRREIAWRTWNNKTIVDCRQQDETCVLFYRHIWQLIPKGIKEMMNGDESTITVVWKLCSAAVSATTGENNFHTTV